MRILDFQLTPLGPQVRKWIAPAIALALTSSLVLAYNSYSKYVDALTLGDELYSSWRTLERNLDGMALTVPVLAGLLRGGDNALRGDMLDVHERYVAAEDEHGKLRAGQLMYSMYPDLLWRADEASRQRRKARLERMLMDIRQAELELTNNITRYNAAVGALDVFSRGYGGEFFASMSWGRGLGRFGNSSSADAYALENLQHPVQ